MKSTHYFFFAKTDTGLRLAEVGKSPVGTRKHELKPIGVKGAMPRQGKVVRYRAIDGHTKGVGRVVETGSAGVPTLLQLPDGSTIPTIGHIIELLTRLEALIAFLTMTIWPVIKEWFVKKEEA